MRMHCSTESLRRAIDAKRRQAEMLLSIAADPAAGNRCNWRNVISMRH